MMMMMNAPAATSCFKGLKQLSGDACNWLLCPSWFVVSLGERTVPSNIVFVKDKESVNKKMSIKYSEPKTNSLSRELRCSDQWPP